MPFQPVKDLDLKHTLECGQVFRWKFVPKDGSYLGVAGGDVAKLLQSGNKLEVKTASGKPEWIKKYFRLDDNLFRITNEINKDYVIAEALNRFYGLRLVRQEPFECLISYICSANSNIPNIRRMVENLAKKYGEEIEFEKTTFHTFPDAKTLACANIGGLKKCGVGFRAKYIQKAARLNPDFETLKEMEYENAKEKLMEIPGVGPKVADCVLLFSLEKLEAFPIDTWMSKIVRKNYFNNRKVSDKIVGDFGRNYFRRYAGYAQEYLFYHARNPLLRPTNC